MKVCFLSWHFNTPEIFLSYLIHMTPGHTGKWKDMEAVTNYQEADYIVVFDGFTSHPLPADRTIYVGQHPLVSDGLSPSFRTYEDHQCAAAIRLDKHFNPGEWWIKYDYDFLSTLKPIRKEKDLICIMTYQTHNKMYNQRVVFMENAVSKGLNVELYGRPEDKFKANPTLAPTFKGALGFNTPDGLKGEHTQGKEILKRFRYTLDFDVGKTRNYVSERFYDSMLLWCLPLYFGSTNLDEYFPAKSYRFIDIDDVNSVEKVKEIITNNERQSSLEAIAEARDLLLNKYQTWPYIYDVINNIDKYRGG